MKHLTLLVMLTAAAVLTPRMPAAEPTDYSKQAIERFARAQTLAEDLHEAAGQLQIYTRFPTMYSEEIHQRRLTTMKQDANQIGDIVKELHQNRSKLQTWQDELLNRLLSRMDTLTDDIGDAIRFLNENPANTTFMPVYRDYVDGAYSQSGEISRTVDRHLNYRSSMMSQMESD